LKMDIEGAEATVFDRSSRSWLQHVKNIVIELHGPPCRDQFFAALESFDYDLSTSGELTVCKNVRPRAWAAAG